MRDYSRFKVTVRGEPKFAAFYSSVREKELKKRLGYVLDAPKEHPDTGDLVERSLWPDEYRKLSLDNLFRVEVGGQKSALDLHDKNRGEQPRRRILWYAQGLRQEVPLLAQLEDLID